MSEPASDPRKRVVSWTQAWPALFLLVGFAVARLHSATLGLLVVAPLVVYVLVASWRMPREEKVRLAAVLRAHDETPWGRVDRLIKVAILLYLVALAVQWLLGRF
jgi:uncharacterized membrane protein